ncbi:hypothetical protein [Nocardia sp. NPDC005998]|uniref:hypothetical protein n=1 Tax=Nocardia sp. NPDC005998 TaxID=3156894 RepID=UPI0033B3E61F
MAPTDDKPNAWQLSGDDIGKDSEHLTVKQKSLQTLAGYAIDLYEVFNTIEGWTHFVENVDGFGNLPSGIALQGKFQRAGRDLKDRAKSHQTLLEDLAQQFITAGKLYTAAEEANTSGFDRLRNTRSAERHGTWSLPAAGSTKIPEWGGKTGRTDKYGGPPADLKAYANEKDGRDKTPVRAEPSSILDYPTAFSWHKSMNDSLNHTADASGYWQSMAEQLVAPATNLGNQMTTMQTSGDWKSDAALKAAGAVQAYASGVQNMVDGMKTIARNLLDTSGWLYALVANTPIIPPDQVGTQYGREQVDLAQRIFRDWYVPGLDASSDAIPLMVEPVSPVVQPTAPPPPERKQNTGPGGGGGGTGGGGTGGGGSSAAQSRAAQQALAAQRQASEQAQKTAADQQRQLEAQRQQAQQEAAQRQVQQEQAAAQQRAQQAAQQAADQAKQAADQGLQGAKQAMDQASQAAQQAAASAAKDMQSAGLAGLPSALSGLGKDALKAGSGGAGAGKGGGIGGGAGGGAGASLSPNSLQNSKLFPRAVADAAGVAAASRAGIASAGQPGSPGGMGPAGHGAGHGQNKEHKRASYLDSVEHIEDALGDAPVVVKPVVEQ